MTDADGGSAMWTANELARIGDAQEVEIASRRRGGALRRPVPVWIVRVGDALYVRSWRGAGSSWFSAAASSRRGRIRAAGIERDVWFVDAAGEAQDAVDDAYREKYSQFPSYVSPMIAPQARATTLRLVPRE